MSTFASTTPSSTAFKILTASIAAASTSSSSITTTTAAGTFTTNRVDTTTAPQSTVPTFASTALSLTATVKPSSITTTNVAEASTTKGTDITTSPQLTVSTVPSTTSYSSAFKSTTGNTAGLFTTLITANTSGPLTARSSHSTTATITVTLPQTKPTTQKSATSSSTSILIADATSKTTTTTSTPTKATTTTTAPPAQVLTSLVFSSNETFTNDLSNSSSDGFKERAKLVIDMLEPIYRRKYPAFISLTVLSFRSGSIITSTQLAFNYTQQYPTNQEVKNDLVNAAETGEANLLKIIPNSITVSSVTATTAATTVSVSTKPNQTTSSGPRIESSFLQATFLIMMSTILRLYLETP
ncbi:uncharacterized protein [Misgurnus anguillicaudatus]|uniref:uncharacterized protein n=1 Tax=Misgurnus anguillicaudatus TaxID=75329 RepID=UPI003CCF5A54